MTGAKGGERSAHALWYVAKGRAELRAEPLPEPAGDEILVRTLYSAVSRGTERLIISGSIAKSEWDRMRAPLQAGLFPFPVKYGYCTTGVVERGGPEELRGRTVFVLHPHQNFFVVPSCCVVPVPEGVPPRRATLAANMETALNAIWDAGCGPADRIVVVGGGLVGLLVAFLTAQMPGTEVTLVDLRPERRALAESFGARFAHPNETPSNADCVFHASTTEQGLITAINAAGVEGTVVELSWYGSSRVSLPLGGAFHSRRLKLVSSQVGQVSQSRRSRWSCRRRLEAALALLQDPRLDALITSETDFVDAPNRLPTLLDPAVPEIAPIIRYSEPVT